VGKIATDVGASLDVCATAILPTLRTRPFFSASDSPLPLPVSVKYARVAPSGGAIRLEKI
jgi:hypothetical protein